MASDYEPLGCYKFRKLKTLKVFGKTFKFKAKSSMEALEKCVKGAKAKDYPLFGIKKNKRGMFLCKEVIKSKDGWDLDKNKAKSCKDNIGSPKSIFIYQKSQRPGD